VNSKLKFEGLAKNVCTGVPERFFALRCVKREQLELAITFEWSRRVDLRPTCVACATRFKLFRDAQTIVQGG
jgi:hypothetical protein